MLIDWWPVVALFAVLVAAVYVGEWWVRQLSGRQEGGESGREALCETVEALAAAEAIQKAPILVEGSRVVMVSGPPRFRGWKGVVELVTAGRWLRVRWEGDIPTEFRVVPVDALHVKELTDGGGPEEAPTLVKVEGVEVVATFAVRESDVGDPLSVDADDAGASS